jgi:hypothetical protein
MKIFNIIWMDDEMKEGILTLSHEGRFFWAYSYPCALRQGDSITLPLQSMDDQDIIRVDNRPCEIEPIGNGFENRITARVEDAKRGIVSVGQIKIELGSDLPGDIIAGDFVSFTSLRLQARKS